VDSPTARRWTLVAGLVVLVLTLAVLVHPGPLPGELGYVHRLQDLGEPVPTLADIVRATTGTEAALIVLIAPAVWAVRRYRLAGAVAVVIALASMLVVQPVMKEVVDRPRPSEQQVDVRAEHESMSYPSGHSMSTTTVWGAIAGFAWLHGRRRLTPLAAAPIVVTFFASGVQGVHWPSDALAGTLLGALAARAELASTIRSA
jgi:membrane-associated phospholipid phosphatase